MMPTIVSCSLPIFLKRHRTRLLWGVSAVAVAAVLWPEETLASEQALTDSLEKVTNLTTGAVAKTGLTVTTIIGTITAAAKHSVGLAAIVMGMGIALSYYLTYLKAWGT